MHFSRVHGSSVAREIEEEMASVVTCLYVSIDCIGIPQV